MVAGSFGKEVYTMMLQSDMHMRTSQPLFALKTLYTQAAHACHAWRGWGLGDIITAFFFQVLATIN